MEGFRKAFSYGQEKNPNHTMKVVWSTDSMRKGYPNG